MHSNDSQICKNRNECEKSCQHSYICKLYVTRIAKGIVKVRRMRKNAKSPIKEIARVAGYELAAAQAMVVPAQGKVL